MENKIIVEPKDKVFGLNFNCDDEMVDWILKTMVSNSMDEDNTREDSLHDIQMGCIKMLGYRSRRWVYENKQVGGTDIIETGNNNRVAMSFLTFINSLSTSEVSDIANAVLGICQSDDELGKLYTERAEA